jgi:hypothetical protein
MIRPKSEERIKFNFDYPQDTDFSAYARLLQSKWRDKKGFPELKLGNFIDTEFAKTTKANFLTDKIKQLVKQEVAYAKKSGGLIGEPRIWNNLLSNHFALTCSVNFILTWTWQQSISNYFFQTNLTELQQLSLNILQVGATQNILATILPLTLL